MRNLVNDLYLTSLRIFDRTRIYLRYSDTELQYYNLLYSIVVAANPNIILELGTGPGISSIAFIRALQYNNRVSGGRARVLHTCDINPDAVRSLIRLSSLVVPHVMSTDELAAEWSREAIPINLLYIDADHSHEQSLADFQHFAPYLVPNGIILMHDTFPLTEKHEQMQYSSTVWKTARYIKEHYTADFEIMTLPFLCGISLLRKGGGKYF